MVPQKTAPQSQKTPARQKAEITPFDQIMEAEKSESERVQKEIEGMERERIEVERAVAEKTAAAEDELKLLANEELKRYKTSECSKILTDAQKQSEKDCETLENTWNKKKSEVIANLVSSLTDPDSQIIKEYGRY